MLDKFAASNTVVIGASADTLQAQQKFTDDRSLKTPLLSDPEQKLIKELGISAGKFAKRVTFVIDKEGKIAKIYTKVNTKTHPDEVLTFVKEKLKS